MVEINTDKNGSYITPQSKIDASAKKSHRFEGAAHLRDTFGTLLLKYHDTGGQHAIDGP
jgi:hypothetical protein